MTEPRLYIIMREDLWVFAYTEAEIEYMQKWDLHK